MNRHIPAGRLAPPVKNRLTSYERHAICVVRKYGHLTTSKVVAFELGILQTHAARLLKAMNQKGLIRYRGWEIC